MKTAPRGASTVLSLAASVEGYIALAIVALSFLVPSADHPSNDMVMRTSIFTGMTFGLALGAARFGKGGGRRAGQVVLCPLSLYLLAIVAVSIGRWEQIHWYWRR